MARSFKVGGRGCVRAVNPGHTQLELLTGVHIGQAWEWVEENEPGVQTLHMGRVCRIRLDPNHEGMVIMTLKEGERDRIVNRFYELTQPVPVEAA